MMTVHFDVATLALYILMCLVGMIALKRAKLQERLSHKHTPFNSAPLLAWLLIWSVVYALRTVLPSGVGGMDANMYITFYQVAFDPTQNEIYLEHFDPGYILFTWLVRLVSNNYHIFLLVIGACMTLAFIYFLREYTPNDICFEPFLLIFFLFLRGFSTFRTTLSIAALLVGFVYMLRKKNGWAAVWMIVSVLLHKASIFYVLALPFCIVFSRRPLTIKIGVLLTVAAAMAGMVMQVVLRGRLGAMLGGAYASYADRSTNASFFGGFWKIAFEQMLLAAVMIVLRRPLIRDIAASTGVRKAQLQMTWNLCMFDFILIPLTFILSIWRGYEYLYLPRLIMWGEAMSLVRRRVSKHTRQYFDFGCVLLFLLWFVFRVYSTYESSGLMPYVLSLFVAE